MKRVTRRIEARAFGMRLQVYLYGVPRPLAAAIDRVWWRSWMVEIDVWGVGLWQGTTTTTRTRFGANRAAQRIGRGLYYGARGPYKTVRVRRADR